MKTWKKIEETKKRTNDITGLKKRNEERVQKVRILINHFEMYLPFSLFYRKYSIFNLKMSKNDK